MARQKREKKKTIGWSEMGKEHERDRECERRKSRCNGTIEGQEYWNSLSWYIDNDKKRRQTKNYLQWLGWSHRAFRYLVERFPLEHQGGLKFKSAKQQTNDRRYSRHNKTPNTLRKDVKIAITILSDKFHLQNESTNESERCNMVSCHWLPWSFCSCAEWSESTFSLRIFFLSFRLPSVRRLTSLASFVFRNCTRRKFSSFLITSFRCGRNSPPPLLYRAGSEIGDWMK